MNNLNFHTAPLETTLLIIGIVILAVGIPAARIRSKIKSMQELSSSTTKKKRRQQK